MIEIHMLYMSNLYDKEPGPLYHGCGKTTPHYQGIMFVNHDRNPHPFYEEFV